MIAVNARIEKLDRRTKNGATGRSDIEGKAVRVTASDSGSERVSIKGFLSIASVVFGMAANIKTASFKIGACHHQEALE
jgi:hypothetical protein